jgi:hypothetical protein
VRWKEELEEPPHVKDLLDLVFGVLESRYRRALRELE